MEETIEAAIKHSRLENLPKSVQTRLLDISSDWDFIGVRSAMGRVAAVVTLLQSEISANTPCDVQLLGGKLLHWDSMTASVLGSTDAMTRPDTGHLTTRIGYRGLL